MNSDEQKDLFDDFEEESSPKPSFWRGKGLYLMCGIALVAIGVASWVAFRTLTPLSTADTSSTVSHTNSTASYYTLPKTESTVSAEKPAPEPSKEEVKVQAEAAPVATTFQMPLAGATVYKSFHDKDLQYSNTYGDYRLHRATDYVSDTSDIVLACGDGIVTDIHLDSLLGNTVTIDHGNGMVARYCGLKDTIPVAVGAKVTHATVIGSVGSVPSETLDAPHLHLEFRKDDVLVSPEAYIK